MNRLTIRLRLTLAFSIAIAIVLAAFGSFLYLRTKDQLDESVNDTLEVRASDSTSFLAATDANGGGDPIQSLDPEDSFAQILAPDLGMIRSTNQVGDSPVLTRSELGDALAGSRTYERDSLPPLDGRVRILATPIESDGERAVSVVGLSLEGRDSSLASLALLLLVGSPAALALAAAAGYWVAGRALSPVEGMRREAAAIEGARTGERLAVPEADDELRRLARTLNDMLGRLEEALDREKRFVADASHELRTPLALHKTELELALRYAESEKELRTAIGSGIDEVDRLARLADDLLVVARSGDSGLPLKREPVDGQSIIETVAGRFRSRAEAEGRSLELTPSPDAHLNGDSLRLEQAVTNMVDNALRHGEGTVKISAKASHGSVRIQITDEGQGWDPAFRPHAFERFSRSDSAREGGGAGLGLSIVETIAEAHGGSAGTGDAPGGGAAVWIDLPA